MIQGTNPLTISTGFVGVTTIPMPEDPSNADR
jgi:hypothetical protein